MIVDELVARIGLEFNGAAAAAKAVASLGTFKTAVLGVGGVLVGLHSAMIGLAADVAGTVDDYADFGDVVGASVETLQALTGAAESAGGSFSDVERGLKTLVDTAGSAAKGNEAAAGAFAQLGVSVFGANGHVKNADQLIGDVADGLAKIPDPARQVNAAIDVLGKGAVKLLPALTGGRRGMEGFRAEMERIGVVMSKASNERFKKLGDAIDNLKLRATGAKNILAQAFLPLAEEGIGWLTQFLEQIAGPLARFGNLVAAPFQLLSKIFQALPSEVMALLAAVAALTAVIMFPTVGLVALGVLIGVLFAALAEDVNNFLNGQESQLGEVVKGWKDLKFHIGDAFAVATPQAFSDVLKGIESTVRGITAAFSRLGGVIQALKNPDLWALNPFADETRRANGQLIDAISNVFAPSNLTGSMPSASAAAASLPARPFDFARASAGITVHAPVNINGSNLSEAELRAAIEAGLTGAAEEISDMAGVRR